VLKRAALGFRAHSGWAALVALTGTTAAPAVILRRRLVIADPSISGSKQPFHAAEPMPFEDAGSYIRRCTESTRSLAEAGLRDVVAELSGMGLQVAGTCVLMGSGRPTGDLAKILSAHPLIHTAEGEFFRDALKHACESGGLKFSGVKERELVSHAAGVLGIPVAELERRATELGKGIGPPWTQDQKLSAIAAWLVLADRHK
jgi:hypothetical protein